MAAPAVIPTASANSADRIRGNVPFFINLACSATPIIVPAVSNRVTSRKAKMTA